MRDLAGRHPTRVVWILGPTDQHLFPRALPRGGRTVRPPALAGRPHRASSWPTRSDATDGGTRRWRMAGRVSMATNGELLAAIGDRYRTSGRAERTKILDEFVAVTGYHRSTRSGCYGR